MSNAPKKIYLQWEEDSAENTWCEDRINEDDIEYIRADEVEQLRGQLDEAHFDKFDLTQKIIGLYMELEDLKKALGTIEQVVSYPADVVPGMSEDGIREYVRKLAHSVL